MEMASKLVAAIHELLRGMRPRRTPRPARRTWRASLAETRRGRWHQTPNP